MVTGCYLKRWNTKSKREIVFLCMEVSITLRNKSADYRLHLPPLDEIHWPHQNRPHYLQSHALSLRALALFPLVYPRHLLYPSDIRTMVIHLKKQWYRLKCLKSCIYIFIYIYLYREWRGKCGFIVKALNSKVGVIAMTSGTQIKTYRFLFAG